MPVFFYTQPTTGTDTKYKAVFSIATVLLKGFDRIFSKPCWTGKENDSLWEIKRAFRVTWVFSNGGISAENVQKRCWRISPTQILHVDLGFRL